jgi:hypothetical protein
MSRIKATKYIIISGRWEIQLVIMFKYQFRTKDLQNTKRSFEKAYLICLEVLERGNEQLRARR